jgi:hypothetical protein
MKLPGVLAAVPLCALSLASAQSRGVLQNYLNKPGFQWTCSHLAHIEFCRPAALAPAVAGESAQVAEASLTVQLRWAGATAYAPRIHIFVLESAQRMAQLTRAYAFGVSQPADHIVCFVEGHPEDLAHEMNHEVMTTLWGPSEPWIAEGLAAYLSAPDAIDDRFRRLAASHRAVSLESMVNDTWTAASPAFPSTVIYPELGSFVKYLRTRFGMEKLRAVWRGGSAAIQRVLGKQLADLENDWRASLERPQPRASAH